MIIDILKNRSSVRNFKDEPISEEIIEYILESGRLSPSGGNEQSWKFGMIDDKSLINRISDIAYNQKWIKSSPLLVVLCTEIVEDERGGRGIQEKRFPRLKYEIESMDKTLYSCLNMEEHQTKIPGTHMVLAAMEKGIYSTWISYFNVEELQTVLNLPKDCIPSEILAFGYPDEEIKERTKKSMDQIVFRNIFSKS